MEELFESTLVDNSSGDKEKDSEDEVSRITSQTMESLKAGERIFEAIVIADQERLDLEAHQKVNKFHYRPNQPFRLPAPSPSHQDTPFFPPLMFLPSAMCLTLFAKSALLIWRMRC